MLRIDLEHRVISDHGTFGRTDLLGEHLAALQEQREPLRAIGDQFELALVQRGDVFPAIERAGLVPLFQTVITGDDARNLKPAPDLYLLAVERLGIRSPLVMEDSDWGVAAGKAAGLEVLRVSAVERVAAEVRARLAQAL